MTVQASLFDPELLDPDVSGPGLFDPEPDGDPGPGIGSLAGTMRHQLARGAWVDLLPGWLSGGDLLERLLDRRALAGRATSDVRPDGRRPPPALPLRGGRGAARTRPWRRSATRLNARYEPELGEPLVSAGLCLYRDGADSVAWHGDTIGRGRTSDTVVAILSLGSPREFLLRPRGGGAVARAIAGADLPAPRTKVDLADPDRPADPGPAVRSRAVSGAGTIRHTLHHGDLVVMGGSCQRTWEHAIPKTARPVGPRVSVQLRPRGVS